NGTGWQALCPAHEDRNPSLSVTAHEGKILLFCHAGCSVEAICAALGISVRDLFTENSNHGNRNQDSEWGKPWPDGGPLGKPVAVYDYCDEASTLLFQVGRFERIKNGEREKTFRQRQPGRGGRWNSNIEGVRRVLYHLPDVLKAKSVVIVEGEKDCETARKMGLVATCNAGGAGKWRDEYSEILRGKHVVKIADADVPGRKDAEQIAASLAGKVQSLRVMELPGAKDLSEWVERGGTRDALIEMIGNAPEWKVRPSLSVSAITRAFSDIKPQPLRWLWPSRIPLGKLTLLVGDPGLGKSLLTIDIAARVSRGVSFPDSAICEAGAVIMASAEDDPADTVRPRLDAADADVSRIHTLEGVRVTRSDGSACERPFQLELGIEALEGALSQMPGVRLIVIDPISAYLGNSDSNSNAEIRGLLAPLAALAARHHVAFLCVTHLRKSPGTAVHRAIASIAFTAAARASWAVAADPSDPARRLMLAVKQNLGPDVGGLAFRITAENGLPRLNWEKGAVTLSANDVLGSAEGRESQDAHHEAESWLQSILAKGPVPVPEIEAAVKSVGLSWATVRRAKESLAVVAEKSGYHGGWQWRLEPAHVEGAQTPDTDMSAFEEAAENTSDSSDGEDEDAQEIDMSIFETGEL
ncbi:MAG: AAA family ATPase, partial [Candidatus Acidiferrales bacterium]